MLVVMFDDGSSKCIHVGSNLHRPSEADRAIMVQADGDELGLILERVPSLNTGKRVQQFYASDAVKAAYCFVDWWERSI